MSDTTRNHVLNIVVMCIYGVLALSAYGRSFGGVSGRVVSDYDDGGDYGGRSERVFAQKAICPDQLGGQTAAGGDETHTRPDSFAG